MSSELMKAYRKENHLTQGQLAEELNRAFNRKYTTALISYTEKGFVELPQNAIQYLESKMREKAFRNRSDSSLEPMWTTIPSAEISSLKSAILPNKELTQNEKIIQYMNDFGSITSWEAFSQLGITRLASRICDLKKEGYEFDRKVEKAKNRYGEHIHYTRYSLRNGDGQADMDRQRHMG